MNNNGGYRSGNDLAPCDLRCDRQRDKSAFVLSYRQRFASRNSNCGYVPMHRDLHSVLEPAYNEHCFALMAVCRKLCFLMNLSVFVIWRRSPPGCLSFSLIFIWKTEPSRPAEWNCVLLALKSVSKISPANIILIHVRPAEIYCWNCNMLGFFASPFWKKWRQ